MKKRTRNIKHGAVKSVIGEGIVCTNVSKDLVKDIDALAEIEGVSRADFIRVAIIREVAFRSYIRERDIASAEIGGGFEYGTRAKDKQYAEQIAIAYKAFNSALALK